MFKIKSEPIKHFTDSEIQDFFEKAHGTIPSELLQYEKKQERLTLEDVEELIEQAKTNNWEILDLSNCGIKDIPESIGNLKNLKILDLSNYPTFLSNNIIKNQIRKLPNSLSNLTELTHLFLFGIKIKELPLDFYKLEKLISINLNTCKFSEFPMQLLELRNLKNLCFGIENHKMRLPNEINKITMLEKLYLPDLEIDFLPETLGELINLNTLYLGRTNISSIPNTLINLKNLKIFDIDETPLSKQIVPEILSQSPIEVINYIIRFQSDINKRLLHESKMIIVGQGGVGKTCLMNRIVNDEYIESPSTEGIDISKWTFNKEDSEYTLNIWDFGGQEIYHATHQFFLTQRSLYVFVWDSRQEDEYGRIDYWLNTIQSFADNCPIIIVINKCDLIRKNNKTIDAINLQRRYPQIVSIYYVSCQDGLKIDELRNEITQAAIDLPLMKTIWFSSWLNIRKALENMAKSQNIIRYSVYLDICKNNNILPQEALSLIKYLHDLGVVLYFYNDNLLKNIIILSTDWGTNAVYKILDSQENVLKNRNGILYYSDLIQIWDKQLYPESTYKYILRLMANFELSFVIKEFDIYLVAELLENKEIFIDLDFEKKRTLNFSYHYEFLPSGIMTRFIVKAHEYLIEIDGIKQCWLKGAYLEYQESYAKVELFDGITERYIKINVSGGIRKTRLDLLQIIRMYFNSIHKSITKIKFIEKILCNCSDDCDYLHDYQYLLKLEEAKIYTERCRNSLQDIEILKLLDGFCFKKDQKENMMNNINIAINPVISNNATASAASSNENSISIDITNNINELQGLLNELKDDLLKHLPDYEEEFTKMQNSLVKFETLETKEDIIKSGVLNKVKRFIDNCYDTDTKLGKVVKGVGQVYSVVKDIANKYNAIAEWCGLPVIPKLLIK